jgi:hypothetical protein
MKALSKAKSMKPGFSDGGEVTDYTGGQDAPPMSSSAATEAAPAAEYKSFKEAFAAERKSGSKTFEYKGKKYTTEMAAPKAAAPKTSSAGSESKVRTLAPSTSSDSSRMTKVPDSMGSTSYSGMGSTPAKSASRGKYASGGLVKRAAVKSHGKAC